MKKTAVLFIHGFMGHPDEFNVLDGYFNGLGYDTHSFLLSGHYKNIKKNVRYDDWVQDCINNMEMLIGSGYKNVILVGHSMGGVLASSMSILFPKFVDKLILINPAFEYLIMKNGKINPLPSLKQTVKIFEDIKEKGESINKLKYPIPPVNEFMTLVRNYKDDIYNVTCPILFLHGDNDNVVPLKPIKEIYDKLNNKNNKFVTVKNGNHWFLSQKIDDEIFEEITNFITDEKENFLNKMLALFTSKEK